MPIANVGEVESETVTVEGRIVQTWDATHPAIQDVGLIADDTGQLKYTSWTKSRQPPLREGDRVRLANVATSWYDGRVSVALTGWSRITRLNDA